jgi:Putative beta-barrel porin 2
MPHMDYQFIVAHSLLAAPGDTENSTIQQFSPGLLIDLGDHWAVDDTVTLDEYSNKRFGSDFNNALTIVGQTVYTDWIFGFEQLADYSSAPLIVVAQQADVQTYTTVVTGHKEVSDHVSMDLSAEQDMYFISGGFQNSRDWTTLDWLNYDFSPRLNIGIGPGLGYVNVDFGDDQTYEEALGRLNWRATDKISFQLNGGAEEWEYLGTGGGALFNPVFGGSIQYQPFDVTSLYFSASRGIEESYYRGEVTDITALEAGVNQRFFGQFYVGLNGGYELSQFIVQGDTTASRTDNDYYIGARLSHSFLQRGTASLFYQYTDAQSTAAGFSYRSPQYGVELEYAF